MDSLLSPEAVKTRLSDKRGTCHFTETLPTLPTLLNEGFLSQLLFDNGRKQMGLIVGGLLVGCLDHDANQRLGARGADQDTALTPQAPLGFPDRL
jgi:hypothetical protein